eukprot:PLAT10636.1.p1 GENE.PLAT10636.1~~PLAT10636.1.p1  ORF type:complete len:696 (+),score=245.14 PLAT10636.1:130-2088(+)
MSVEMPFATCIICYDAFDSAARVPKLLSCGHSFCQACVVKMTTDGFGLPMLPCTLSCPLCGQETTAESAAAMPKNYALMAALPMLCKLRWAHESELQPPAAPGGTATETEGADAHPHSAGDGHASAGAGVGAALAAAAEAVASAPACSNCSAVAAAEHYCTVCSGMLCGVCDAEVHALPLLAGHRRVPVAEGLRLAKLRCTRHPHQQLLYSCSCDALLCATCMADSMGEHSGHTQCLLSMAIKQRAGQLRDLATLAEARLPSLLSAVESITAAKRQLATLVEETEARVVSEMEQLREMLREREQEVISRLHSWRQQRELPLDSQLSAVEHSTADLLAMQAELRDVLVLQGSEPLAMMRDGSKLLGRLSSRLMVMPEGDAVDVGDISAPFDLNSIVRQVRLALGAFGEPCEVKEWRCLMLGLDGAGKTTMLTRLAGEEGEPLSSEAAAAILPTIGFNVETVSFFHNRFTVWDVGGGARIRALWSHYYDCAEALIFVVDCSDEARLAEAAAQLQQLAAAPQLRGRPLLVLANKCDAPGALPAEAVREALQLDTLPQRAVAVYATSATVSSDVDAALTWLSRVLRDAEGRDADEEKREEAEHALAAADADLLHLEAVEPVPWRLAAAHGDESGGGHGGGGGGAAVVGGGYQAYYT